MASRQSTIKQAWQADKATIKQDSCMMIHFFTSNIDHLVAPADKAPLKLG